MTIGRTYSPRMDIRVLGPLRVTRPDGDVEIPGAKERTLLLALVARIGRTVPVEDLVDALWGDQPPRAPTKALQTYVLRLRNALEPHRDGAPTVLVTDPGGYRLALGEDQVDQQRFATLAELGHRALLEGRYAVAADTLDDALALWRGPAYAGFRSASFAEAQARRLDELHLAAQEDRWAAELELSGGHATAAEVEALLEVHPFRERLWALLVRALYRSGRQADALDAYERARTLLLDELGVDPGPELRALHRQVLAQDPALAAVTTVPTPDGAEEELTEAEVRGLVAAVADPADVERATADVVATGELTAPAVRRRAAAWVRRTVGARVHEGTAALNRSATDVAELRSRLVHEVSAVEHARRWSADSGVCPWRGLASYTVDDAEWYAGRERLVAELVTRVSSQPLVVVVGASGSGKSSLVHAGLLAALRDGRLPGSDEWPVVSMRPGVHPVREVAQQALTAAGQPAPVGDSLAQLLAPRGPHRTLLVVDQLEELFTLCTDVREREEFLDLLGSLVARGREQVGVVLVVRADFVARLAEVPALSGALSDATVLVGSPTPAELGRAVRVPAERSGLRFDPGLDDSLVDDAGAEPGSLPLLSTCLSRLWERRDGDRLTYAAYVALGGLAGAIAHVAEEVYESFDADRRQAARVLLLRLAGPGAEGGVARRRVPMVELAALPGHVGAVVPLLVDARLLTAHDGQVEVAHESLFREWPRLAGWLNEDETGRRLQRRLAVAAAEWEAGDRDPGLLWRGARLASGLDVALLRPEEITPTEHEFLDQGRAALEAETRAAEDRAEAAQRSNRRLRWLLGGLAVVLAGALVAGALALDARREAVAAGQRREAAAISADAKRLAAQSLNEEHLDLALLQAVEAVRTEDAPETRGALMTLISRVPTLISQTRSAQFLRGDASPDGRTVFLSEYEPRLWAFDAESGEVRWTVDVPRGGNVWSLDAGPEGLLGSVHHGDGGMLVLWDPVTGEERWRLTSEDAGTDLGPGGDPWAGDAVWTADGRIAFITSTHVGYADANGRVRTWQPIDVPVQPTLLRAWPDGGLTFESPLDVGHRLEPATGRLRRLPYVVETVSPDGRRVVTADRSTPDQVRLQVRDARSFAPVGQEFVVSSFDSGADWTDDGRRFVVGVSESLQVRDRSGRLLHERSGGHSGAIMVALFAGADRLWSGGRDGVASVWSIAERHGVLQRRPITGSPFSGEMAVDGSTGIAIQAYQQRLNDAWLVGPDGLAQAPLPLPEDCACQVMDVAIAADGSRLAGVLAEWTETGFDDRSGRLVWWSSEGGLLGERELPWLPMGVDVSDDGRAGVVNGRDGYATVDLETGEFLIGPVGDPGGPLRSAAAARISPDGSQVALVRDRILLLDLDTGDVVAERALGDGPGDAGMGAAWSVDGRYLSISTFDARIAFLRGDTLEDFAPARQAAAGLVAALLPSPDGRWLATLGSDGDLRLWDAPTAAPLGRPLSEEGVPGLLAWDATGDTLRVMHEAGTEGADGRMRVIDTDLDRWVAQACSIAHRQLTPTEWAVVRPGVAWRPTCPEGS